MTEPETCSCCGDANCNCWGCLGLEVQRDLLAVEHAARALAVARLDGLRVEQEKAHSKLLVALDAWAARRTDPELEVRLERLLRL